MSQIATVHAVVRDATYRAATYLAAPPDPGAGSLPPGSEGITTVLSWMKGVGIAVAVGGLILIAIKLFGGNQRGQSDTGSSLARWGAGCLILGSASAITGILVPS